MRKPGSTWRRLLSIKWVLAVTILQGLGPDACALEIMVGDRPIDLPLPDGFVELTAEMSPYYETMRAYVGPNNVRYTTLITASDAQALLRGEDIDLERYINVETEKNISAASVSAAMFTELRNAMRSQHDEVYANLEQRFPELVSEGNESLSEAFDAELAVELGGLVPLPIHLDTDDALASSMFMTVRATVNGDNTVNNVVAVTSLILHVKDKVLFVYVYGPESDLEWTRDAAETWLAAILAANPLSAAEQAAAVKSGPFGIDWNQVADSALIGALIGGVIGLFSFVGRRLVARKRKKG